MKKTALIISAIAGMTPLLAQVESPAQSTARPFGLDIIDTVQLAGSDAASADFQQNALPQLQSFVNENLGERQGIENLSTIALDPSKLYLSNESDVRVYFIGEGAGYHNTLGFSTEGASLDPNDASLIFPDASSPYSYYRDGQSNRRSNNTPLQAGDFVDLGQMEAGSTLDFFLIANGAYGGNYVWSTEESANVDGLTHVVSLAEDGSPYLLIGFEDLYGGGDKDYNDLVFAVDIGTANVAYLANPEPSTFLILIALFALIGWSQKAHLKLKSVFMRSTD
ncbi:DUF4114 domain-containing protein [Rubellicoccus peritrichatus]|uniref:DUF4114 domain-containing protein n=1 Tax=Rubellicoccus peritrichatus TaxID=3080537 RepID=A0AAQ3LAB5_9BACT|nr:DUF4114 domain-containing protein [Puniceicoccus sp. CR14]WOO42021.1 DUF4114 domain-containing protein [Puniceicoccus sp. CR14]